MTVVGGALELPPFGRDAVRETDRHTREALGEVRRRFELVPGVLEGEEERDRDRLEALIAHRFHEALEVVRVEGRHHLARRRDPLARGEGVLEGGEGLRLVPADREDLAAVVALNRVDVAEALGREKRDLGAPAGEEGIEAHGGAVDEEVDGASGRNCQIDAAKHRAAGVVGRREDLRRAARPGRAVLVDDIGERPADIGTDAIDGFGECRIGHATVSGGRPPVRRGRLATGDATAGQVQSPAMRRNAGAMVARREFYAKPTGKVRGGSPADLPDRHQARSNRSRFITLSQAATKSSTNRGRESSHP